MPPKGGGSQEPLSALELKQVLHAAYKDIPLPDVLGDFGMSARFLVDGEALVAAAVRRAGYTQESYWQTLHLVFCIERWLEEFALRRGRFDLVFVTEYDALLWALFAPAVRAARLAVLHHLCNAFDVVHVASHVTAAELFRERGAMAPRDGQPMRVFVFDRLFSGASGALPEQFLEFVDVVAPAFVLTNMAWPKLVHVPEDSHSAQEQSAESEQSRAEDSLALVWALPVACRMAKVTLLVLDDLEFLEANVHGRALVSFGSRRFSRVVPRISATMAHAASLPLPMPSEPPWSAVATGLFRALRQSPVLLRAHERDSARIALNITIASTAAATLLMSGHKSIPQLADVVTAWVMTSLLQSTLEMSRRAYWFRVGKVTNKVPALALAERLVNEIQVVAVPLLSNSLRDRLVEGDNHGPCLVPTAADMFDVRLFYFLLTTWFAHSDASDESWLTREQERLLQSYLREQQWWPTPLHPALRSYPDLNTPYTWSKMQADVCSKILADGMGKRNADAVEEQHLFSKVLHVGNTDLAELVGPSLLGLSGSSVSESENEEPRALDRDHHWHSARYLEDALVENDTKDAHSRKAVTAHTGSGATSSQVPASPLSHQQRQLSQLRPQPVARYDKNKQPQSRPPRAQLQRMGHLVVVDEIPADPANLYSGPTGQIVQSCVQQDLKQFPSAIWYQTQLLAHWTDVLELDSNDDYPGLQPDLDHLRLCCYLLVRDVLLWLVRLCPDLGVVPLSRAVTWNGRTQSTTACLNACFRDGETRLSFLRSVRALNWPELSRCVTAVVDVDDEISANQQGVSAQPLSLFAFQLKHAAPYLRRSAAPSSDSRVQFHPDAWQLQLLNIVDRGESALVVAPTSSGKTFVSFYAIERLLRSEGTDVLVYVAPTKALVNQTLDEVRERMGRFVADPVADIGVFTRERRESAFSCRVLITVPQCLDILLMSPERHKDGWIGRLKYVIFDEVHNIACENGEVWEMLLLLVPCSILALSATIGQADRFCSWLQAVHERRGRPLHFVEWDQRYNDLEMHVYVPSATAATDDQSLDVGFQLDDPSASDCKRILSLAAWIAALPERDASLVQRPIGADVRVLPEDCIALYERLAARPELCGLFADFEPDVFFAGRGPAAAVNLSMPDVRAYEDALKARLFEVVTMKRPAVEAVPARQASDALCRELKMFAEQSIRALASMEPYEDELLDVPMKFISRHIFALLASLKRKQMLPAAVFHLDRRGCEAIARALFNSSEKLGQSLFTAEGARVSAVALNGSSYFDGKYDEGNPLHAILPFGIAVHHAGLPHIYRSVVERLFRAGHVTVVIATGTLAQGLNMPCRSVVFAGWSVFLDSINFRQMSGRAGRRGFDLRGHVVLMGLSPVHMRRLILSGLPIMRPNQPLTPSLALRIASKLAMLKKGAGSTAAPEAADHHSESMHAFARLLECSLERTIQNSTISSSLEYRSHADSAQIFRLFLHLLRSVNVLRSDGNPSAMSTLISHIHYLEPTNFVLVRILQSGVLDDVAATATDARLHGSLSELDGLLLNILCHIVQVKSIPDALDKHKKAQIALQPLPESVNKVINDWNESVIAHTFAFYVWLPRHLSASGRWSPDCQLPYSQSVWPADRGSASAASPTPGQTRLDNWIDGSKVSLLSRSSFSGMGGASGSKFSSMKDLVFSRKVGLAIPSNRLPIAKLLKASQASAHVYHFILDDMPLPTLAKRSGFAAHEIVQDAYDFLMAIKSVVSALDRLEGRTRVSARNPTGAHELVSARVDRCLKRIQECAAKKIANYRDQVSA